MALAARAASLLPTRRFRGAYENVLGTSLELQVGARAERSAQRATEVALAEIDRLEPLFSRYNPQSELSRWQAQRGVPTPLSPELLEVLHLSQQWQERSKGTFHPGVESLTQLWKAAQARGTLPTESDLARVREYLADPLWELDRVSKTACFQTRCAITLNAIAKGYIVDQACFAASQVPGVQDVLLSIGGDLRAIGSHTHRVGIADPNQDAENAPVCCTIGLRDAALATSGGYRRGFLIEGRRYSHLLDPRTGWPVEQIVSASVVAPTTTEADVLATVCSLLHPEESLELAQSVPSCAIFLVTQEGRRYQNARWTTLVL